MLVNWKHPRLLKAGSSMDGSALLLKPGVNDVNPEHWDHAAKTPLFKHYLAEGDLEVVPETDGREAGEVGDLSALNESKARKLVKDTNDEDLLLKWHSAETRQGVQKAIENQLDVLAKASKPAGKE